MSEGKKTEHKKVSVIVPNYNYARYLKWRLLSIARQTYPIDELIILDDKSTDNSRTVIRKLAIKLGEINPRMKVRVIFNEKNSGKAISQWIKGVTLAKGDYIWIAEADDIARRNFLEEVMKGFERDSDVVISYAESAIINKNGILLSPNFRRSRDKEGTGHFSNSYIRPGKQEIEEIMAIRCTIPNVSAVVFKKTPELLRYLKQAEKFEQVGDWYLYARLLENRKIFYNKKSLNLFRVHKKSATKRGKVHLREVLMMQDYFRKKYNLSESVIKWMDEEARRIRAKYGIIE